MGFPLAEIIRIALAPVAALGGPVGVIVAPSLLALANEIDKEDDDGHEATRKMKRKRRENWIKFAIELEKTKRTRIKNYPEPARATVRRQLNTSAGADLRAVIRGDIFETENRDPDEQEINLYAEAVSARAREKL